MHHGYLRTTLLCTALAGCLAPADGDHPDSSAPSEAPVAADELTPYSMGVGDFDLRWPGGVVHYCYLRGELSSDLDPRLDVETVVNAAAAYIHDRVPSVSFVNHGRCTENEYAFDDMVQVIRHVDDDGNDVGTSKSAIGRQGGQQYLRAGTGARVDADGTIRGVGTLVHELLHALGVRHEHQRSDRDQHVTVCWLNVKEAGNFEISEDQVLLSPYDPQSLMHYRADQGMVDDPVDVPPCGRNTLYSATADITAPRGHMTLEDINGLSLMYGFALNLPLPNDVFGTSVASGDFDGDGYDDLAVGAANRLNNGDVFLYKGTWRYPVPNKILKHPTTSSTESDFGRALAVGDFNGDGIDDLAVGSPKAIRSGVRSGTVTIYWGGRFEGARWAADCAADAACRGTNTDMLGRAGRTLSPADYSNTTDAEGDRFGAALTAGDFNGDGKDDLVVGAPGKASGVGRAYFYSGSRLAASTGAFYSSQFSPSQFGTGVPMLFGAALTAGDFSGDGRPDLAIGAPGLRARVYTMRGVAISAPTPWQVIPSPNTSDEFGFSLATGPLFGDRRAELVVGAPRTANSLGVRAGGVHVYNVGTDGTTWQHADELVTGSAQSVRFGHAVAVVNFDDSGRNEVAIGAPLYQTVGRIVMAGNTGTALTSGEDVVGSSGTVALGTSLAATRLNVRILDFESVPTRVRLVAGAPLSRDATFGMQAAGFVNGYASFDGDLGLTVRVDPLTKSPWTNAGD